MKNCAILIFTCLATISCTKQTNDLNVPVVSDSGLKPTIIDGTLSFGSIKELTETWGYLSKLSINGRKKWEETYGFYSVERRTEEGFEAIHKANVAESDELLNRALLEFSDVIELRGDTYTPIYDNGPYDLVCNLRGIFITSKFVQKVNSKVIDVYNLDDFNDLNNGIEKTPVNSFHFASELYTKSLPTYLEGYYFYNPSGCKNDREVFVTAHTYVGFVLLIETNPNYPEGLYFYEGLSAVNAEVYGKERNWLCRWSRYATILSYRNASFTGYGYQNEEALHNLDPVWYPHSTSSTIAPFTVTHSFDLNTSDFTTQEERYNLMFLNYFGYRILNEGSINDEMVNNYQGFISAHFEATTRGADGTWVVIDYNGQ